MITLSKIELGEKMSRDTVYLGGSPIGVTAGIPFRTVTVVLNVDDTTDVSRIHAAIADLTSSVAPTSPCDMAPGCPLLG